MNASLNIILIFHTNSVRQQRALVYPYTSSSLRTNICVSFVNRLFVNITDYYTSSDERGYTERVDERPHNTAWSVSILCKVETQWDHMTVWIFECAHTSKVNKLVNVLKNMVIWRWVCSTIWLQCQTSLCERCTPWNLPWPWQSRWQSAPPPPPGSSWSFIRLSWASHPRRASLGSVIAITLPSFPPEQRWDRSENYLSHSTSLVSRRRSYSTGSPCRLERHPPCGEFSGVILSLINSSTPIRKSLVWLRKSNISRLSFQWHHIRSVCQLPALLSPCL